MRKVLDYILPYAKAWIVLIASGLLTIVTPDFIDGLFKVLGTDLSADADAAIVTLIVAVVVYLVPNAKRPG